ncbi:MAG: bifunctional hydroxymethylpyrimidine kinase/phosphomethylpyrimidine kinase [Alphaproteobacteria bacterium]
MTDTTGIPTAMTIAGSDSGGGAGIQADLKTFSALGAYGASAITALTAQNTVGVTGIFAIDPAFVAKQIDTVLDDIRIDAIKIGMLGTPALIDAVADALERRPKCPPVVLDPVMVAKSGDPLLPSDAVETLINRLVPLATVITPNLPETGVLLGRDAPGDVEAMKQAARDLTSLGPRAVLVKGGHLDNSDEPDSIDLLLENGAFQEFRARRIATENTHGTGCTLSSAIAAGLAKGLPLGKAAAEAHTYLQAAIAKADTLHIGSGHGPVHHFHDYWKGKTQ